MRQIDDSRTSWYAVYTRSRQEAVVSRFLADTGIEHYLPSFEQAHQWSDRRKLVTVAAFPGYLFVHCAPTLENRRRVLQCQGVVRILGHGPEVFPVPDEEILAVRRLLESHLACEGHPLITEGAWVRVRHGALRGLEGLLLQIRNQSRLVVSVHLLGRSVSAEIPRGDLEFLSRNPPIPADR